MWSRILLTYNVSRQIYRLFTDSVRFWFEADEHKKNDWIYFFRNFKIVYFSNRYINCISYTVCSNHYFLQLLSFFIPQTALWVLMSLSFILNLYFSAWKKTDSLLLLFEVTALLEESIITLPKAWHMPKVLVFQPIFICSHAEEKAQQLKLIKWSKIFLLISMVKYGLMLKLIQAQVVPGQVMMQLPTANFWLMSQIK